MRSGDSQAMPPEVAAALDAMDAALAGEPADPGYADLAELALILRDERPVPATEFAAGLDERAERRFARSAPSVGSARPAHDDRHARSERPVGDGRIPARRRWAWPPRLDTWLWGPLAAVGAAVAGVAVVIVLAGHGGGGSSAASSSAASAAGSAAPKVTSAGPRSLSSQPPPGPSNSGNRQIVQSAQLQLTTAPGRVEDVAQQVFGVVGTEKGIVNSSHVTATGNPDGYANFQLSIPSGVLGQTLTALSQLRGARVASRTDDTTDITGRIGGAGQRLAEARALRRSLLRQLAAAATSAQTASLTSRLHDADASIASDLSTLRGLQRQVAYSTVTLTIQAGGAGGAGGSGGGFTIGRAGHDAGRVLVVVAGVALIALAVLVPVGLVAALVAWAGLAVRRRRREQALDVV